MKKVKGISVIALVITIVVLVVLTATAVIIAGGENGVIGKANKAVSLNNMAVAKEKLVVEMSNAKLDAAKQGETLYEHLTKNANEYTGTVLALYEGSTSDSMKFLVDDYMITTDNNGQIVKTQSVQYVYNTEELEENKETQGEMCILTINSIASTGSMTMVGSIEVENAEILEENNVSSSEYILVCKAKKGDTVTIKSIARSTDSGTKFLGWSDGYGTDETIQAKITEDTTITAYWDISGCFVAGTKIMMSDWTEKNIEDIVVGDKVISYNTDTNEYYTTTVAHIGEETVRLGYYEVELENGTIINPTSNHPLLTAEGFKAVSESIYFPALTTEDSLVTINGTHKIVRMEHIDAVETKVYYIDVIDDDEDPDDDTKDTHIANGVVVHNGIYNMLSANMYIWGDKLGLQQPVLGADKIGAAGAAQEVGPQGEDPRPASENPDPIPTPVEPKPYWGQSF